MFYQKASPIYGLIDELGAEMDKLRKINGAFWSAQLAMKTNMEELQIAIGQAFLPAIKILQNFLRAQG